MDNEQTLNERLEMVVDQLLQLEAERDAICTRLRRLNAMKTADKVQLAITDLLAVGVSSKQPPTKEN